MVRLFWSDNFNNGKINYRDENDYATTITKCSGSLDISDNIIKVCNVNPSENGMNGNVYSDNGISPTLLTNKGEGIKIVSANSKGYEEATEGDNINLEFPESKTRRGRVGKGVAQTLDTGCNQGVIQLNPSKESGGKQPYQHNRVYADYGLMTTLDTDSGRKSVLTNYKIRRLTPRECFRLMDFPDTFTWPVSDSQAYKQAGNSIVVNVLYKILKNLNL